MATVWPKLTVGKTYRFDFVDAATGEHRYGGVWTVRERGDSTAGAFRAYVMRWTKHQRNLATITEVPSEAL